MTLLEKDGYRVHTISKFTMPAKRDGSGKLIFDGGCFAEQPIKYGLGIEAVCGRNEDGSPYYYVLALVHWDDAKEEFTYDVLPDRIIDEWVAHPDKGAVVKEMLTFAQNEVMKANKGE